MAEASGRLAEASGRLARASGGLVEASGELAEASGGQAGGGQMDVRTYRWTDGPKLPMFYKTLSPLVWGQKSYSHRRLYAAKVLC